MEETVRRLNPVHFPAAFPEVFLRERPGFDCLLGNPPWEKVVVDREVWWGLHLPGVRSLPVARRRARINEFEESRPDLAAEFEADKRQADALKQMLRLSFPKLGSGSTDLYKAFSWANLSLVREGGSVGTVLPRSAVADAGMAKWRTEITNDNRSGQVRSGQVRSGQVRSGQVRSGQPCPPSSTTGGGCSRGFTTPTRWPWCPSGDHVGCDLSQLRAVGVRRSRRALHLRPGRPPKALPPRRPQGVALRRPQMSPA